MLSFCMFVLTSKDESLPLWSFAEEKHIFSPVQIENLGTCPRLSFVLALGCRGNLWLYLRDKFSLCLYTSGMICSACCSSCPVTCWFNSAVASLAGQLMLSTDLGKTVLVWVILSYHVIKSKFSWKQYVLISYSRHPFALLRNKKYVLCFCAVPLLKQQDIPTFQI